MPLNDLFSYTIESNESGSLRATVSLNFGHALYKGHFPEQPVTPGVCLLEIFRQILSVGTGKNLMLISARDIKFINTVVPPRDENLDLKIDYKEVPEGIAANCILSDKKQTYTKVRGIYDEE